MLLNLPEVIDAARVGIAVVRTRGYKTPPIRSASQSGAGIRKWLPRALAGLSGGHFQAVWVARDIAFFLIGFKPILLAFPCI